MADEEEKAVEKQVSIQKIYIKDFSFESPQTPQVFKKTGWEPKTNLNIRSSHTSDSDNTHEVVLTLTIEAKDGEESIFLIELHQAGMFLIAGYTEEEFKAVVGSFCPNLLFPYARETISSVVSKGGFPEFILQPINFDALYAHGKAQAEAEAKGDPAQAVPIDSNGDGSGNGGNNQGAH
ncbi:MAG: preprotein translocase subunit SecB [Woeseiaceae bacterium]|jgi:preprotein translocase subunit SecB